MTLDAVDACLDKHPDIRLAYVFGSVTTGRSTPHSDVDVAVLASGPLDAQRKAELIGDIAACTGRAVDLIDLATVGEPLLGQILRHGKRLRGDASLHAQLISRHILDNEDFMPYVNRMLAERRRAWTR